MFWTINLPIFRSTRLRVTACGLKWFKVTTGRQHRGCWRWAS